MNKILKIGIAVIASIFSLLLMAGLENYISSLDEKILGSKMCPTNPVLTCYYLFGQDIPETTFNIIRITLGLIIYLVIPIAVGFLSFRELEKRWRLELPVA